MDKKYKVAWVINNIIVGTILALSIFIEDKIYFIEYWVLVLIAWLLECTMIKKRFLEDKEFIDKIAKIVTPVFLIVRFVLEIILIYQ